MSGTTGGQWWEGMPLAPEASAEWWQAAPREGEAAPYQAAPIGRLGRFAQGFMDLPTGFRQMVANVLPDSTKPMVNTAMNIAGNIPATRMLAPMFGNAPPRDEANRAVTEREAEYQARLKASGVDGVDWARLGGQLTSSLPAMVVPGANTFLGAAGIGAATGAGMGALSPVPGVQDDYGTRAAMNAAVGGAAGAAGGLAGKAIGSVVAPRIDPNVRTLADAGVELTPGQIIGGTVRKVEDAATSMPVLGTGIANAQRRSLESFNRAVANEVLAPIGQTVPKTAQAGRALIGQVDDAISQAYDDALSRVRPFSLDDQFMRDFGDVLQNNTLFDKEAKYFSDFFTNKVAKEIGEGPIDGATFQRVTSMLKKEARSFGQSIDKGQQKLGEAFRDAVEVFDDLVARTNPNVAADIKKANTAFARLIRMEGAAASAGAKEGVFTAPQLSAAVRRSDMAPRKGQFARGNALMQNLSDPANALLPSTVPDSGTGIRSLVGLGVGTGAGYAVDPAIAAAYLGATGAGRLAYSEPATRAFRALMLAQRPGLVGLMGEGVRRAGQASGYPAAGLMGEVFR